MVYKVEYTGDSFSLRVYPCARGSGKEFGGVMVLLGRVEREDPLRVEFFGENKSTRKGVLVVFDGSMRKGVAISEKTGSLKEGFFHKLDKYL